MNSNDIKRLKLFKSTSEFKKAKTETQTGRQYLYNDEAIDVLIENGKLVVETRNSYDSFTDEEILKQIDSTEWIVENFEREKVYKFITRIIPS